MYWPHPARDAAYGPPSLLRAEQLPDVPIPLVADDCSLRSVVFPLKPISETCQIITGTHKPAEIGGPRRGRTASFTVMRLSERINCLPSRTSKGPLSATRKSVSRAVAAFLMNHVRVIFPTG